jgi:hypothetical protein
MERMIRFATYTVIGINTLACLVLSGFAAAWLLLFPHMSNTAWLVTPPFIGLLVCVGSLAWVRQASSMTVVFVASCGFLALTAIVLLVDAIPVLLTLMVGAMAMSGG